MGKSPKKTTFEQAINELETIVQAMEEGNLTLDECVEKYQRGQELAGICQEALESARKKLQVLKPDGTLAAQGSTDDVPF